MTSARKPVIQRNYMKNEGEKETAIIVFDTFMKQETKASKH